MKVVRIGKACESEHENECEIAHASDNVPRIMYTGPATEVPIAEGLHHDSYHTPRRDFMTLADLS